MTEANHVPVELPKGDVPGDNVSVHPVQIENAKKIFQKMKEDMPSHGKEKLVISVYGGSGSGKSGTASLLTWLFREQGIGAYLMSGDNYPLRMPKYNDAERVNIYRRSAIHGLIEAGEYTEEHFALVQKWQQEFDDANPLHVTEHPWFAAYRNAGAKGLKGYLGTDAEQDYEEINSILEAFKNGAGAIWLKRLGREDAGLWYEKVDFSDIQVVILEWTHGNSAYLKNVDYPIYLHSTPEETLQYRMLRNRDNHIDNPFTTMVLEIEQNLLYSQADHAKLIVTKSGEFLTVEELQDLMKKGEADE